jgi:hypothetical protein
MRVTLNSRPGNRVFHHPKTRVLKKFEALLDELTEVAGWRECGENLEHVTGFFTVGSFFASIIVPW